VKYWYLYLPSGYKSPDLLSIKLETQNLVKPEKTLHFFFFPSFFFHFLWDCIEIYTTHMYGYIMGVPWFVILLYTHILRAWGYRDLRIVWIGTVHLSFFWWPLLLLNMVSTLTIMLLLIVRCSCRIYRIDQLDLVDMMVRRYFQWLISDWPWNCWKLRVVQFCHLSIRCHCIVWKKRRGVTNFVYTEKKTASLSNIEKCNKEIKIRRKKNKNW